MWTSRNGLRWRRVPNDTGLGDAQLAVSAVLAARHDRFLLATRSPARTTSPTATTTATTGPSAQPPNGQATLCIDAQPGVDALFASANGTQWTRLTQKHLSFPGASLLTAAHGRWLAAANAGSCQATRAAVYLSQDGRGWDPVIQDPQTIPGSMRFPMALSTTETGAVVFVGDLQQLTARSGGPDVWIWTAPRRSSR